MTPEVRPVSHLPGRTHASSSRPVAQVRAQPPQTAQRTVSASASKKGGASRSDGRDIRDRAVRDREAREREVWIHNNGERGVEFLCDIESFCFLGVVWNTAEEAPKFRLLSGEVGIMLIVPASRYVCTSPTSTAYVREQFPFRGSMHLPMGLLRTDISLALTVCFPPPVAQGSCSRGV